MPEEEKEGRGTFCGTLNYMTPEMLEDSVAMLETDLWALGIIIFKMVTGRVPFPGLELYTISPLVCARDIAWPSQPMDPVCKDLIDQLL